MDERREVVDVNLSGVMTAGDLHAELSRALEFPNFYGHNWDAFWDAITGLVEMPKKLCFHGWQGFAKRLPSEAYMLCQCLEEMEQEHPEWASEVEFVV
ncbi:barstar family protein [Phormidesmis sp. 146-33]